MSIEVQELTLTGALNILFYKAQNTKLARRRHQLLMRENERKLQPQVKEFMDYMTRKLKAGIPRMKGKTATQRAKSIVNWKEIRTQGEKILKPAILAVLTAGGENVIEGLIRKSELKAGDDIDELMRKQIRFDPIGQEAVAWTTAHSAELVVEITQETMVAIRNTITTGINAGKSMPAIARELRPIVGLHSQYAGAVGKFHTGLIAEGVAAQKATAKAETYANRLQRRRTATIARTETAFGLTEGQRQGYGQMGINRLERVEDPATEDDDCAENNGRIYTMDEAQGVLPAHPNCEGTWIAATGETAELRNFYNNVTDSEITAIQGWSDDTYLLTRQYLRAGEIERENLVARLGPQLKADAEKMESLFLKYKDGVSDKVLYRGLGDLPDDVYDTFKKYKKGEIAELDTAISSWTTDAGTMEKFSGGKNQIKFYLDAGRKNTLELDIKDFARIADEKEVILNTHKFKITLIEEEVVPSPIPGFTGRLTRILNVYLEEPG